MFGEYSVKNVRVRHGLGKVDDVLAIMAGPEIQMPKSHGRLADDMIADRHKFAYTSFSVVNRDAALFHGRQYTRNSKETLVTGTFFLHRSKCSLVNVTPGQHVTESY